MKVFGTDIFCITFRFTITAININCIYFIPLTYFISLVSDSIEHDKYKNNEIL